MRQENFGKDWMFRFNIIPVIPSMVKNPLFQATATSGRVLRMGDGGVGGGQLSFPGRQRAFQDKNVIVGLGGRESVKMDSEVWNL